MDLGFAYKIMRTRAPAIHPSALSAEPSASALPSTATAEPTVAANPRSRSPSPPKQLLNTRDSSPITVSPRQQPQPPAGKSGPLRSLSAAPVFGLQRGTGDGTRPRSTDKRGRASPEPSPTEPSLPSKLHMVPRLMLPSARGVTIGPFAEAIVATIAGKHIRRRADPLSRPAAPVGGTASSRSSPKRCQSHRRNSSPSSHAATARVVRIAVQQPGYAPPPSAPTMMTVSTTATNMVEAAVGSITTDNHLGIKRAPSLAGPLQLPRVMSHHKPLKQHTAASLMPGRAGREEGDTAAVAFGDMGDGGGGGGSDGGGGAGGSDPRSPSLETVAMAPSLTINGYVADSGTSANNRLDSGAAVAASSGPSSASRGRLSGASGKEAANRIEGGLEAARCSINGDGGDGTLGGHFPAAAAEGVLPGIAVQSWRPPSSEEASGGEGQQGHRPGMIARRATLGPTTEAASAIRSADPLRRHTPRPKLDDVEGSARQYLELAHSPRGGVPQPQGNLQVMQSVGVAEGVRVDGVAAAVGHGADGGGGGRGSGDSPRDALPRLPSLPSLALSASNSNSAQPGRWALAAGPGTPRSFAAPAVLESPADHRIHRQTSPTHANLHAIPRANSYTNLQRQQSHSPLHYHPPAHPHPHPHPQAQTGPQGGLRMPHAPSSGPSFLNIPPVTAAVATEPEEGDEGEIDFSSGGCGVNVAFGVDLDFGMDAELEALEQWAAGGQAPPSVLEAAVEQRRALRRLSQLRHKLLVARSMCSCEAPEPGSFIVNGVGSSNGDSGNGGGGGIAPPALPSWAAPQSGLCGCEPQSLLALASQVSSLPHIDYEAMRDPQYRMKLKLRAARQPKGLHPTIIGELEDMPIRSRHRPWKPLHI